MPPQKKAIRDRLNRLRGGLASPKKAIKRVASAFTPRKLRPSKKHRPEDPDDSNDDSSSIIIQDADPDTINSEAEDVFTSPPPAPFHSGVFYQGSTPEPATAAPAAFKLSGRLFQPTHHAVDGADDRASISTFPTARAPPMLDAASECDDDGDDEIVPPALDELCAVEAGNFGGDGYPRPAPSQSFLEKMTALGAKQAVAVAPDITNARAALSR
ncbi:hypothetical protein C8F04DRAFT_1180368 [Mycena alexandri]|uniref:Uncharacterized protein n=1 Tax=Mycena alexandri TaxID=1745969 RepID=A0AAD6T2K0_9AGAR|nr:hypothetical protein C8F04DRAFT_1180368 [Mycena alexandri]